MTLIQGENISFIKKEFIILFFHFSPKKQFLEENCWKMSKPRAGGAGQVCVEQCSVGASDDPTGRVW